jgi:hypothetical protein
MRKSVHYYKAGNVERFARSKRSYVWHDGYSQVLSPTSLGCQPWVTYREAQTEARDSGGIARFHETLQGAQAGAAGS